MITLKNPLSIEERLQTTRLIGHDGLGYLHTLLWSVDAPEKSHTSKAIIYHIRSIEETVLYMTSSELVLNKDFVNSTLNKSNLESRWLNDLSKIFPNKLEIDVNPFGEILTEPSIIYTMLFNLVKNANSEHRQKRESRKIRIEVTRQAPPENIVYSPDGAQVYEDFVAFSVRDFGRGFPTTTSLREQLVKKAPEIGEQGFGLYFVHLAARLLRTPIHIESSPGNTAVSIYQPVYKD